MDPEALAAYLATLSDEEPKGHWSLKVWAQRRVQQGDEPSAFDNVPLSHFFTVVHVEVQSTPTQTTEWHPSQDPQCVGIELVRTTPNSQQMTARVGLRLKQPKAAGAGPVSPLARVQVARHLATLLHLSPEHHYSYFEVEEALWLFLKERR